MPHLFFQIIEIKNTDHLIELSKRLKPDKITACLQQKSLLELAKFYDEIFIKINNLGYLTELTVLCALSTQIQRVFASKKEVLKLSTLLSRKDLPSDLINDKLENMLKALTMLELDLVADELNATHDPVEKAAFEKKNIISCFIGNTLRNKRNDLLSLIPKPEATQLRPN